MILLIDFTGFLVICALAYQGYIEGLQFRPSLMIASLCSVIVFTIFFSSFYVFIMEFIPYSIISGLLTVAVLNSVCIFVFYRIFGILFGIVQNRFFIPQVSDRIRKIGGMIIGACVGYIFIAGMITSVEQSMVYKKHRHTKLVKSVFYESHKKHNDNDSLPRKIDNLPALHELYSEENVMRFNWTEDDLVIILKMIREISNAEAKEILEKIHAKENFISIYLYLIDLYSVKKEVSKKYFINTDEMQALRLKINSTPDVNHRYHTERKKLQKDTGRKKSISDIIDTV